MATERALVLNQGLKNAELGYLGCLFGLAILVGRPLLFLRRAPHVQAAKSEGVPGSSYSRPTGLERANDNDGTGVSFRANDNDGTGVLRHGHRQQIERTFGIGYEML